MPERLDTPHDSPERYKQMPNSAQNGYMGSKKPQHSLNAAA
jgi:hypothetical protein